ncbi:MAG TPA: ImmA/IrrE family metallo-endopeptidase [Blastocatellia bacterium]|nr:ImmA/IrrE family metallo-endopeptidase [Blastocatellia bacterium]
MRRDLLLYNTPPEWNVRVLTQDDFDYYCDRAGIVVREISLELPGLYICRDGHPQIFLSDELRGVERLFIAFHELAHHWLHPPGVQMFHGFGRRVEFEADVVAACALIPKTTLTHYWPSEIADLHGYTYDLVNFRCEIFDKWKI